MHTKIRGDTRGPSVDLVQIEQAVQTIQACIPLRDGSTHLFHKGMHKYVYLYSHAYSSSSSNPERALSFHNQIARLNPPLPFVAIAIVFQVERTC